MRPSRCASILPLTLVLTFVMLTIGWSLTRASCDALRYTSGLQRRAVCRAAARSGLELAVQRLAIDPAYRGSLKPELVAEGPEAFRIQIFDENQTTPVGKPISPGYLYIQSTGILAGIGPSRASALVNVQCGLGGVPGLPGIYGGSVSLTDNCFCDSYSSLEGFSQGKGHAVVVTNSDEAGSVRLSGSSQVRGQVSLGPTGVVDETITLAETATYSKAVLMRRPMDLNDVLLPYKPGDDDVDILSDGQTLPPGSYNRVTVGHGVNLDLSSGIYVFNRLEVSDGAQIDLVGEVPVQLYVTEAMTVSGSASLSSPEIKTSRLQIFLAPGSNYQQRENSSVSGIVYGPAASVALSDGAMLYGSVVADAVSLCNSSGVYFDEQLNLFAMVLDATAPTVTVMFREFR